MKHGFAALALALAFAGGALIGPAGASALTLVIAPFALPALIVESAQPAPGPGWSWVAGHWEWRGHWVWMHGYWTRRPRPDAVRVDGRWVERGGRWVWVEGRWR